MKIGNLQLKDRSDNHKYIDTNELDDHGISEMDYYKYDKDKSYDIKMVNYLKILD